MTLLEGTCHWRWALRLKAFCLFLVQLRMCILFHLAVRKATKMEGAACVSLIWPFCNLNFKTYNYEYMMKMSSRTYCSMEKSRDYIGPGRAIRKHLAVLCKIN